MSQVTPAGRRPPTFFFFSSSSLLLLLFFFFFSSSSSLLLLFFFFFFFSFLFANFYLFVQWKPAHFFDFFWGPPKTLLFPSGRLKIRGRYLWRRLTDRCHKYRPRIFNTFKRLLFKTHPPSKVKKRSVKDKLFFPRSVKDKPFFPRLFFGEVSERQTIFPEWAPDGCKL